MGIPYFIRINIDSSQMLYYLINRYKPNRWLVLKLGLKVSLGVPNSLTKEVEHFSFFRGEIVIVNIKLSLHLNSPVLKGRVYTI